MATNSLELTPAQKKALLATDSKECKNLAESTIVPYSSIISALESIQDQNAKDICAKAFDSQATAQSLIDILKKEVGTSTDQTAADNKAELARKDAEVKRLTEEETKSKAIDLKDSLKVHLQLAEKDFMSVNEGNSPTEMLKAYQYNYGLLIAKEREHWIRHIDDQAPALSLDWQWQGMKWHNPIVRDNQFEHVGRQAAAVINWAVPTRLTGVVNEKSGGNIMNYSHETGMKMLTNLASQYDKNGQTFIELNGEKIIEGLSDDGRKSIIKKMLIDANESVKSEGDTYMMVSTALGIPVAYLMLLGTLRSIEKVGGGVGKIPYVGGLVRPIGSVAGWSADHLKAQGDAFMTWAKSSGLTWEKARDIAKARLTRAKAELENPTVNEDLKKAQVEDIKDPIRDLLWSQYEADLQKARPGYTSDDFAKDIKDGKELPTKSLHIREEIKILSDKASKFLPIDPSSDPLDRELRTREIEKVLPSNFLDKFYRKVFEGRNPIAFLSNNRWWSMSEKFELGSESPQAKAAREEFTRALSKIDAELGTGIDGEKIKMRLPKGHVDAAKGVKNQIDIIGFQSAVQTEHSNDFRAKKAKLTLDLPNLSDLTTQSSEEIKKLQKMYGLALANNARTNYDDLKDKFDDAKQALDDATVDKDKYADAEKDLKDLNDNRNTLKEAKEKFVSEKLNSVKTSLQEMLRTLGGHSQSAGIADRTQLRAYIVEALSADVNNIDAKVTQIRGAVGVYDNAQSDSEKKVGSFVDTAENSVREMGQVDTHASLSETRNAVTAAEAKFNAHVLPQGENTDFRSENRRLARAHKKAEVIYDEAKKKFEAIPSEVRDLLERKTDVELKAEKTRVDRVVRAHETKAKAESERATLRTNVEKTGARIGMDPDAFKRGERGSIPDAGKAQLADFARMTSDPTNDLQRMITEARARGYEIRTEGKKVTIIDNKPGEIPKTYDTTVAAQEKLFYEHLAKQTLIKPR